MKIGFDNDKYQSIQSEHIKERISQFDGKLYLELGGKLFDDHHASRVLPGFLPDSKLRMFQKINDSIEIVIVISATDIEKNKKRADLGITYDEDVLRLRGEFQGRGFMVGSVVITHWGGQPAAVAFKQRLERLGIRTYCHYLIEGYPHNVELIASDEGFGKNDYVETERPLVIVTAPGPGSGKMAVCLSQLYNENKRGVRAGYAKFETFPVWNLPLKHPVNIAYEAATADLNDVNMIDPFHLEAYNKIAINYNRDIEIFPVLNALFEGIYGTNPYKSPTDMGVNMVGFCISDDDVCVEASKNEIIRRYYAATNKLALGACNDAEIKKIQLLMQQAKISTDFRRVTTAAKGRLNETGHTSAAIELQDGTIISANSSPLLGCSAALILNVTKHLAGIDHDLKLIPESMIEPIQHTKISYLGGHNPRLHTDEVIVALSVLSEQDENCRRALEQLPKLRDCQVHSTVMLSDVDQRIFKKLGVQLTCEPVMKTVKR
ncbi:MULTISPECIES: DUF1846 domain-containing protein [Prevotella]|jgi:uncharacterized protein (UPF0371 family)|uniref:ATP-dependent Zn protease n=2 Tax=Prevotella pectinovora TaxID=1602169 RepID=A0A0D0I393_9BACT|nr:MULTISPECIES: DUF1846 domain-containing protein [Prevotella]KIP55384.1 hypothetical protein ST42_09755 [Prevotella pectinovora]KIP59339.1 hypothetical protein ST41_01260 [Prevotella pectinovora]KIP60398.1 hypothetical protein ST44_11360 [Prevotella pectinovora]KIP63929.1 hypothetical protein ST45_02415 [Prevotella pectinovora]MCI6048018.1 DUF1846 domain-containing protein [Prevotella pectinovora]